MYRTCFVRINRLIGVEHRTIAEMTSQLNGDSNSMHTTSDDAVEQISSNDMKFASLQSAATSQATIYAGKVAESRSTSSDSPFTLSPTPRDVVSGRSAGHSGATGRRLQEVGDTVHLSNKMAPSTNAHKSQSLAASGPSAIYTFDENTKDSERSELDGVDLRSTQFDPTPKSK
jgi:hypothetical protein